MVNKPARKTTKARGTGCVDRNYVDSLLHLGTGLLLGMLVGWLAASWLAARRPAPTPLEGELRQQLTLRESDLNEVRGQLSNATQALASAEAGRRGSDALLAEQRRWHEQQLAAHKEAQTRAIQDLREAFQALSAEALRQTQPEFLRLATETLGKYQEAAKGDLAQRHQAIASLVEPLKDQLQSYQQRLRQSETAQSTTLGELKGQLDALSQHSLSLSSETLQLRRILSSNQARGRWGEETLRRVVEAAGMSAHCDFTEQAQAGDSKPDMIVRLPGDRIIIVDAKVPDLEFLSGLDAADVAKRAEALSSHARKLKETIRALADRDYPSQFPKALDYVVLFLPAESLFSAALEGDQELIVWAANRKILLATPASLIALLRSVAISWQQHSQTENARAIAEAAQELFSRVVKFTEHFERIRAGLERANSAYNDALGSYERMVRPSGERLVRLGGLNTGKELPEVDPITSTPRLPSGQ
jgi:DNA recombination protein RmuC